MTWNILFERMRYILWPNLIHYSREPTSRELVRREPLEKKELAFMKTHFNFNDCRCGRIFSQSNLPLIIAFTL